MYDTRRLAAIFIALSVVCLAVAAHATPRNEILFIFNHGSKASPRLGFDCYFPLFKPRPQWLNAVDGQVVDGKRIRVVTPCTGFEAGGVPDEYGCGQVWVCNRAIRIAEIVERYRKHGYPAENIFLGGQSAGGWASLLIKRWNPGLVNGVIVTAPAFNGKRRGRFCRKDGGCGPKEQLNMQNSRHRYRHELNLGLMGANRPSLRALIFAFPCDPYARPGEVFFAGNETVETRIYPEEITKPLACANPKARYRNLKKGMPDRKFYRCDEPQGAFDKKGPVCGSGKTGDPTLAQILNCPDGLKDKCERNQHTQTHRSDDFRDYIANNNPVVAFIKSRMTDNWTPPLTSPAGRTPCSFIDFPDECRPYRY